MITLKTYITAAAFMSAVAAALASTSGSETALGTFAIAYGDDPSVTGTCNPGTMPSNCTTAITTFGFCKVTFSSSVMVDARTAGCSGYYYRTN